MNKWWICLFWAFEAIVSLGNLPEVITQSGTQGISVSPTLQLSQNAINPNMQLRFTIPRDPDYIMANFYDWYKLEQGIFCTSGSLLWSLTTNMLETPSLIVGYDSQDEELVQLDENSIAFLRFDTSAQRPTLVPNLRLLSDNTALILEYQRWQSLKLHRPIVVKTANTKDSLLLVQSGNALLLIEKNSGDVKPQNLAGTFSPLNSYFVSDTVDNSFYFFEYNQPAATICYMNVTRGAWTAANWLSSRVCTAIPVNPLALCSFSAIYDAAMNVFRLYILNQRQLQYHEVGKGALRSVQEPVQLPFDRLWRGDKVWLASVDAQRQLNMLSESPNGNLLAGMWIDAPPAMQLTFLADGSVLILSPEGKLSLLNLEFINPGFANHKIRDYVNPGALSATFDAQFNSTTSFQGMLRWGSKRMVVAQLSPSQLGVGECGDYILPVSCQVQSSANIFSNLNFIQLLSSSDAQRAYAQRITIRIYSEKFTGLDIGTYICVGIVCTISVIFILIFFFFLLHGRRLLGHLDAEASF